VGGCWKRESKNNKSQNCRRLLFKIINKKKLKKKKYKGTKQGAGSEAADTTTTTTIAIKTAIIKQHQFIIFYCVAVSFYSRYM